jgi:hypothetical protein
MAEHIHGHLGPLSTSTLLHPAILLRNLKTAMRAISRMSARPKRSNRFSTN